MKLSICNGFIARTLQNGVYRDYGYTRGGAVGSRGRTIKAEKAVWLSKFIETVNKDLAVEDTQYVYGTKEVTPEWISQLRKINRRVKVGLSWSVPDGRHLIVCLGGLVVGYVTDIGDYMQN